MNPRLLQQPGPSAPIPAEAETGAYFSADHVYRYVLWRRWDRQREPLVWVMLNPSTADDCRDDPTITRCRGFARNWGYGGITVVNLFALRATRPEALRQAMPEVSGNRSRPPGAAGRHQGTRRGRPRPEPVPPPPAEPVGPDNDAAILHHAGHAGSAVCAWGNEGALAGRGQAVREMLEAADIQLWLLRMTRAGQPAHPLYLPGGTRPRRWR